MKPVTRDKYVGLIFGDKYDEIFNRDPGDK